MPANSMANRVSERPTSSNVFAQSHMSTTVDGGRVTERSSMAPSTWTAPCEQRLADMLFYSLNPNGGGFDSAASGLDAIQGEAVVDELREVIDIAFDNARRSTYELAGLVPDLTQVPLEVHASYSREEILAALGFASLRRTPSTMREGVAWCESANADAFLITLKKSDNDYSPTTMYRDFALSPDLFHWESQSTTSSSSRTGQRYIHHRERGSHILLFVRQAKTNATRDLALCFPGSGSTTSRTKGTGRWRSRGGCIGQCRQRFINRPRWPWLERRRAH